MTRNILPTLVATLALSVSPLGLAATFAQDAPILPKHKTPQGSSMQPSQQPGENRQNGAADGAKGSSSDAEGSVSKPEAKGAEPMAPQGNSAGTGSSQTTPQQPADSGSNMPGKPSSSTQSNTDQNPPATQKQKAQSGSDADQKPIDTKTKQSAQPDNNQPKTGGKSATGTQGGSAPPAGTGDTGTNQNPNSGASSGSTSNVTITTEQQTQVRQVIKDVHVEPVRKVDFNISVGTNIPRTITLEPLPPRIIDIVPQYKTYRFFILDDGRIVIVDPDTFTIVYIITA
jgi:hypothetical protein